MPGTINSAATVARSLTSAADHGELHPVRQSPRTTPIRPAADADEVVSAACNWRLPPGCPEPIVRRPSGIFTVGARIHSHSGRRC